ncbi:MAG: hypothetical protein J07HB67_00693 [halophilic archaeon J07HB67]|jgi:hypothetical protein|nr:MAG: hypothetical protein J07HB67_00693 [halophilic archaeon J07HB67]
MSRDGRQRQRERESDTSDRDSSGGVSGGRTTVSDRTSWSGLAKRAYNVAVGSRSGRSRSEDGSNLKLAGLTFLGAFATGLLPLPLTWLLGIGVGAAAGGWTDNGSAVSAAGIGGVVGLLFGLGFAPVFFGLGSVFTLALGVVSAVLASVGYLFGE